MRVDLSAPLDLSRPVAVYCKQFDLTCPARIICTDAEGATGLFAGFPSAPIVALVKLMPGRDDETPSTFPLDGGPRDAWYVLRNISAPI